MDGNNWFDLSDDELRSRLLQRPTGMDPEVIKALVMNREHESVIAIINEYMEW